MAVAATAAVIMRMTRATVTMAMGYVGMLVGVLIVMMAMALVIVAGAGI